MDFEIVGTVDIALVLQYLMSEEIQLVRDGKWRRKNICDHTRAIKEKIKIEFLWRHFVELQLNA